MEPGLEVFICFPPDVGGQNLGDLDLPGEKASVLLQVRRGATDILPRPDLVLEFGDRVGMLAHRHLSEISSEKRSREFQPCFASIHFSSRRAMALMANAKSKTMVVIPGPVEFMMLS